MAISSTNPSMLKHPLAATRYLQSLYLTRKGGQDRKKLEKEIPELRHFIRGSCSIEEELYHGYREYVSEVSSDVMAVSFELACFLWSLCKAVKPKRILDLGSGFSSLLFRLYRADTVEDVEVWSVDDNNAWLAKTRDFLIAHGLQEEHLLTWQEFDVSKSGLFDLILHDMGSMEFRAEVLDSVINSRSTGGIIIFDDVQKPAYHARLADKLRAYQSLDSYDLRAFTIDKYTRYALLVKQRSH